METITIRKYKTEDQNEVISLIVDSFESKFLYKQALSKGALKEILVNIWTPPINNSYVHFVVEENGRVVDVILVQINNVKKSESINLMKLFKTYGFKNISTLLLKMSLLEHHKYTGPYIEHLAVNAQYRGKNIGGKLINAADESLKNSGFNTLTLAVTANNPAQRLYKRKGFKVTNAHTSKIKKQYSMNIAGISCRRLFRVIDRSFYNQPPKILI